MAKKRVQNDSNTFFFPLNSLSKKFMSKITSEPPRKTGCLDGRSYVKKKKRRLFR